MLVLPAAADATHSQYAGARGGFGIAKLSVDVQQRAALALPPVARSSENDVPLLLR